MRTAENLGRFTVTVDELAVVAAELGEPDRWEVAARFAASMLPGIFRVDDPVLGMRLPVETRQRLEELLGSLPTEVLRADDALGWVYQYWQSRRKDEVNRSERKIGGADLSPVTQLFTEDYMVRFLLENSLGAWWAAQYPESALLAGWEFLRFTEQGAPAAGSFEEWPQRAAEVTVMDPCCGSGHFLVAAFGMLWRMRAEEEDLEAAAAQDAVLRENLFGLELDPRCTQIAAFALALEAWKSGGYRVLPLPQVACSGIPARAPLAEWTELARGDERVKSALARLHSLFVNADTLGSLIDPVRATEDAGLESVDWHDVAPLVNRALTAEADKQGDDPAAAVFGEAAAGIARAADYLSRRYTLTATNVPYLEARGQSRILSEYLAATHRASRYDLATAMLERELGGSVTIAAVSPQNWLSLKSYHEFRKCMLRATSWNWVSWLGAGAFTAISGEVVNVVLTIHSRPRVQEFAVTGVDASQGSAGEKRETLKLAPLRHVLQSDVSKIPDARFSFDVPSGAPLLKNLATGLAGIMTGDSPRFVRFFWEVGTDAGAWAFFQSTVPETINYGGRNSVILWEGGEGGSFFKFHEVNRARLHDTHQRGSLAWGRRGVAVRSIGDLPATLYTGERFDNNVGVIFPKDQADLAAIWCFVSSDEFRIAVRRLDRKMNVTNATLVKVPFDLEYWRSVAEREFPKGLPEPFSSDATQWLFRGRPLEADQVLQVAVARLLGYGWPDQEPDVLDGFADEDGLVCLPAVGGESPAADRRLGMLSAAWGQEWSTGVLDELLAQVGANPGRAGLEGWLRNGFCKDHCKVFGNRPFVWHVWDGAPDGFSALVNYHRLDRRLLERLTYDYLGSWWVGRVRDEVAREMPGATKRLAAAEELQRRLRLILEGDPPYDIFVRWKDLSEQPIGWDPDLDDGVRVNIRPFMIADVLRFKPNIKWTKDRGKNPDGSERLNDLHYTTAEKHVARGAHP